MDANELPPGPTHPPFVSLARWIARPLPMLEECERRYGDFFTVRLPKMPPNVVFTDPDAVRDLFTAPVDDVRVGEIAGVLRPVMGERSVMLLDGEAHRHQRRRMMPPFRPNAIATYGESIRAAATERIRGWKIGQPLDVLAEMQHITLDVILDITLAPRTVERRETMKRVVERFLALGTSPLATLLLWVTPRDRVTNLVYRPARPIRIGSVSLRPGIVLPWAPIVEAQDALDAILYEEIAARRHDTSRCGDDLLSLLMSARDEDGQGMTDVELRDQMVTLLLAGHETTATTLAWTLAHLLENGAEWTRLSTRLAAMASARNDLTIEDVVEEPLLDGVLRESMRLSPVAPTVGRHLRVPMKLGRVELPAGVNAIACVYLTQRRGDLFEQPLRFSPDRWVGQRTNPYQFFPFGGGARRCLGMALAYYEMKIILAEIALRVSLRSASVRPLRAVRKGVTFAPAGGLPAVVEATV